MGIVMNHDDLKLVSDGAGSYLTLIIMVALAMTDTGIFFTMVASIVIGILLSYTVYHTVIVFGILFSFTTLFRDIVCGGDNNTKLTPA